MSCCCAQRPVAAPRLFGDTESVCPVCLERVPAQRIAVGDNVVLRKTCPEHGTFSAVVWRGVADYAAWGQRLEHAPAPPATAGERGCPFECGLCPDHLQISCCVLLEVTSRCNLACPVCFASAGGMSHDPSVLELDGRLDALRALGHPVNIQLSGGEPTVRDDLPGIVALCKAKGFPFVQINTNGIRIANDPAYLARLKRAGLDCVFLQFDGIDDGPNRVIRGADLFAVKERAIERCAAEGIGVVLVPVLMPGVNAHQIGGIIRFAADRVPTVRAVHFQPVSYFGRYPGTPSDAVRLTIPDVLRLIEDQTDGEVRKSDFHPGAAENPYCSFNGRFTVSADGAIRSARPEASDCGCGAPSAADAERSRRFVSHRWAAEREEPADNPFAGTDAFDAFLANRGSSLAISGMVFQDAWTLDLDRVRRCYIHIASPDGRLVPLCAYNLSSIDGTTAHRRVQP